MSVNPIEENSTPKTTGSLEELFRHHLGEEAAVSPSPMLWDQIDNSLLIRQNEIYRRRLTATRWVAAASLLLATLAGTGWWAGRSELLGGSEMAAIRQPATSGASRVGNTGVGAGSATRQTTGLNGTASQPGTPVAIAATSAKSSGNLGIAPTTAAGSQSASKLVRTSSVAGHSIALESEAAGRYTEFGPASARYSTKASTAATRTSVRSANGSALGIAAGSVALATRSTAPTSTAASTATDGNASAASAGASLAAGTASVAAATALVSNAATGTSAAVAAADLSAAVAVVPTGTAVVEQTALLASRQTALDLVAGTSLPNGLATVSVPVEEPAAAMHRWHYGASYTASAFNPNINFSRKGIEPEFDYNHGPAFGDDSPALTEAAATEYRNNLRSGLSQRIALLATRHLRGHWSLSTGAEFTQATASSASSTAFVGEQLFDLSQGATARPMRTTDFRYHMASIPLEVRYSNPVKRGWSLYGRLGGVVTALLGVRSDVEGDPEATRTYSITSGGMPYRRVMGSLRGGAGTQFRTSTGKWAFTMGPVAEIGLVSMNAHPVQSYFAQSHPYSFGLEAGVEFGR
jgi:hypothetical protein